MKKEITFEGFGYYELKVASELLLAYSKAPYSVNLTLPISIGYNSNSNTVYLYDENSNVAMFNDVGILENFITCYECGYENFESEFKTDTENHCEYCIA